MAQLINGGMAASAGGDGVMALSWRIYRKSVTAAANGD